MPIVVTLGDSYMSGEGIEPYYGQSSSNKYYDQDWIAHRSSQSWASYLEFGGRTLGSVRAVPSSEGTRHSYANPQFGQPSYYVVYDYSSWSEGNWFFAASSASYLDNIYDRTTAGYQGKGIQTDPFMVIGAQEYTAYLSPQIQAIDYVNKTYGKGSVDYVTITAGANDLSIATDVFEASVTANLITPEALKSSLESAKQAYQKTIRNEFIQMFKAISNAAGPEAKIIYVGYPTVFDGAQEDILGNVLGFNIFFDRNEMQMLDDIMRWLDEEMHKLVLELNNSGMANLYYVSLVDAFQGHGAYSSDSYIMPFILPARTEDIDKTGIFGLISLSSMHPNEKGARAIAGEVQKLIDDIELVEAGEKAHVPGWAYTNGKARYYEADGSLRRDAWALFHGELRYLDSDGTMATNAWRPLDGTYYYLGSSGRIVRSGWASYNGKYYYLDADGIPVKDTWIVYNGKYWLIDADGNPVTNSWVVYEGSYYYLGSNGNPVVNGWVLYKGDYYYMDGNGNPLASTWRKIDGTYYYFNESGICVRSYK